MSAKVIEAMRALGIGDVENVDRVVVDLRVGHIPVIHVRHHGGGALLDLVDALTDGPRIEWVDDGRARPTLNEQGRPVCSRCGATYSNQRALAGATLCARCERGEPEPPPVDVQPDPWLRAPAPGSPA